jgi:shikimate dehydrogenase
MIDATTRVIALLGDPVHHSLSPGFQNAAFREAGVNGVYVALRCGSDDLPALVRALARAGGGGNVTLPHKERAAQVVDVPTEAVQLTGACNTFWLEDGQIHGDNTDVTGVTMAARHLLGREVEGLRTLVLGAGGAARGTIHALLTGGVEELVLWNRTASRARDLASDFDDARVRVSTSKEEAVESDLHLIVNATSLGLQEDDPLPLPIDGLSSRTAILDLVYRPDETALVRAARSAGLVAADGGEMLVQQGARSFRHWWGREPSLETMREALQKARKSAGRHSGR